MDVNAIPDMDATEWGNIVREKGVVFYDSTKGDKPTFMDVDQSIKVFDVKEETAMAELEAILAGKEYVPKKVKKKKVRRRTPSNEGTVATTTQSTDLIFDNMTPINPLTSNEIEQLEIQDPNPQTVLPASDVVTEAESNFIDEQMARSTGEGYILTDDTTV